MAITVVRTLMAKPEGGTEKQNVMFKTIHIKDEMQLVLDQYK